MKSIQPIQLDVAGACTPKTGMTPSELVNLQPALDRIKREVLDDQQLLRDPPSIPADKEPLDAAFIGLPDDLSAEYHQSGSSSEVGRILATANRLAELVDRVVVLGIGGSYMSASALMEACCQPYFNELDRGQRGSRPRMYFEGNNVDNDASQGLRTLLGNGQPASSVEDRWGIVVISKSGGTLETAVAFRQFLRDLRASCRGDDSMLSDLVVPVTGSDSRLFRLSEALGCRNIFPVPDGVGGRFSILSAVGLLPAAILGLDIVRLLEGAVAMNEHFRQADPSENLVLQYVAVCHQAEQVYGAKIRVLSVWAKALESFGFWYDQLLAESLGKNELGSTPITVVNTRDLHSRAQQHQEGRRDKLICNLVVENWRCDPLSVGRSDYDHDKLNALADKTLPEIMTAAIEGTNKAYADEGRPTIDIRMPQIDEATLGQLLQMMMLATVVEGRLLQINPYGQPGVEAYKTNMKEILSR